MKTEMDDRGSRVLLEQAHGESPRAASAPRRQLGEVLIDRGVITYRQLQQALIDQREHGGRLGEILVANGYLTLSELTEAVSEQLGVEDEPRQTLRARVRNDAA